MVTIVHFGHRSYSFGNESKKKIRLFQPVGLPDFATNCPNFVISMKMRIFTCLGQLGSITMNPGVFPVPNRPSVPCVCPRRTSDWYCVVRLYLQGGHISLNVDTPHPMARDLKQLCSHIVTATVKNI